MARTKRLNLHLVLNMASFTDKALADFGDHVGKLAATSVFAAQHPAVQAAIAGFVASAATLRTAATDVDHDEGVLALSRKARDVARIAAEKQFTSVRGAVEQSTSAIADAASVGLNARIGGPPKAPLAAPDGITVKLGKKHGQFRVIGESHLRASWEVATSSDPIGPATWITVEGSGKTRIITGHPSGALVWVRMRLVRGATASDWCAPVPVTVP